MREYDFSRNRPTKQKVMGDKEQDSQQCIAPGADHRMTDILLCSLFYLLLYNCGQGCEIWGHTEDMSVTVVKDSV